MSESPQTKAGLPTRADEPRPSLRQAEEERQENRRDAAAIFVNTSYLWILLIVLLVLVLYLACRS